MNHKLYSCRRVSDHKNEGIGKDEEVDVAMRELEEDGGLPKWDFEDLKEKGVDWWTRFLLKTAPYRGAMRLARMMGFDDTLGKNLHQFFARTNRIHVEPLRSGRRGFQLVINNMTALYFYQNGDHFEYDGFELGAYKDGRVTVFDECAK